MRGRGLVLWSCNIVHGVSALVPLCQPVIFPIFLYDAVVWGPSHDFSSYVTARSSLGGGFRSGMRDRTMAGC